MQHLGRHLVLLTLSGVLLVNLGRAANGELAKQDSLPALVLDEAEQAPASNASPPLTTTPDSTVSSPSSVSVSSSTLATQDDAKESPKKPDQEVQSPPNSDASSEQPKEQPKELSSAAEADAGNSDKRKSATDEEVDTVSGEKDIRVLLANKNDAENDLAQPAISSPSEPTLEGARSEDKKKTTKLDSPVDISGGESGAPQPDTNDNRFHYSLGGSPDKSFGVSVTETTTKQPSLAEESKGDTGEKPSSEKSPAPKETSEPPKELASDPLTGKKVELDDKTKAIVVESVPVTESKPDGRLAPADDKDKEEASTTTTTTTTTPTPTTTTTTTSTSPPPSSSTAASTESSSAAPTEQAKSEPTEAKLAPKDRPTTSVNSDGDRSESDEKNVTITAAKPIDTRRPLDAVPSVLATALGTALGGAVTPLLKNDKEKPLEAAAAGSVAGKNATATTTSTTTKAPSSVTTRKSTTDKWDRYSPSTPSSSAPPTRRRPILPSIRRRFRPYNRFSPFPWSTGVDAYSNDDAEFAGTDPFNPRLAPPVPTTSRPPSSRRRGSSSAPPKTSDEPETDSEPTLKPQESGGRRRGQGANKRRHNRPHRYPHPEGESEVGVRRYNNHHHGHRHFEREDRGPFGPSSADSPNFGDSSNHNQHHFHRQPARQPLSPGFGLFNTGSTGTGFDLLNPFSGWLDDALKPRPPARAPNGPTVPSTIGTPGRRPGVNPIAVGGDYNDEQPYEHGPDHPHHHQNRPHNGREDYYGDHHHHHDCDDYHGHDHDHDHDHGHDHDHHDHHREPYRPQRRPQREPLRPPVGAGGDYDTYPASASFGRRPSRPYNRRDQAEIERKEEAGTSSEQAAPSLYGATAGAGSPVVARRVPSMLSPFDTLFGSLDDGLFGLRSSFVDAAPASKPAQETAFDTVLSSPKISVPSKETSREALEKSNKPGESAGQKPSGLAEAPETANGDTNDFLRKTRAFG